MNDSYPALCPKQKEFPLQASRPHPSIQIDPSITSTSPFESTASSATLNSSDTTGTSTLPLPSPSPISPHHQRRHSVTYEPPPPHSTHPTLPTIPDTTKSSVSHSVSYDNLRELPLSMRFIHKPSRSQELYIKASDPTKANSLLNAQLTSPVNLNKEADIDPVRNNSIDTNSDVLMSSSSSSLNSPQISSTNYSNGNYKLVRKKSGELLKPSLKGGIVGYFDKKRSLSLPATPTYKQVHFGSANDIRYFKKKDKPAAISATNSPTLEGAEPDESDEYSVEEEDSENEDMEYHNFYLDNKGDTKYPGRAAMSESNSVSTSNKLSRHVEWELKLLNFPPLSYLRKIEAETPVFLEKLFLSVDKRHLLGYIAVKNLSFEKYLTVRYSLDLWNTIIEIPTAYIPDRPEVLKLNDYDRFTFKIPLNSLFNSFRISKDSADSSDDERIVEYHKLGSQEKTYEMCIKYYANSAEFWDNNEFKNYQIKLIKTTKGGEPPAVGKILEHTTKPKYSNAYLKRVQSDSQIELHKNEIIQRIEQENELHNHHGQQQQQEEEEEEDEDEDEEMLDVEDEQTEGTLVKQEEGVSQEEANRERDRDALFLNDNSSDLNDFVKNNYYLSSPLLSSLHKNPDISEAYIKNTNDDAAKIISPSPQPTIPSNNYKAKFQSQLSGTRPLDTTDFNKTGFHLIDDKMEIDEDTHRSPLANRSKFLNSKSYKELLDNYCFFSSSSPTDDDHSPDGSFNRGRAKTNTKTSTNGNGHGKNGSSGEGRKESYNVSSFLGT